MLPNGTPSQPFAEWEVAYILEQNPPPVAPDERRNLASGQHDRSLAPAVFAVQKAGRFSHLFAWHFGQSPASFGLTGEEVFSTVGLPTFVTKPPADRLLTIAFARQGGDATGQFQVRVRIDTQQEA